MASTKTRRFPIVDQPRSSAEAFNQHALSGFRVLPTNKHATLDDQNFSFVGPSTQYVWNQTERILGQGYTSTVHRGKDVISGEAVAIKVVPKEKQRLLAYDAYYRQLYLKLFEIRHPNLIKLIDFFEDAKNSYVVMELCTGPDLVDYVLEFEPGTIPPSIVQNIVHQILLGLHSLHQSGILHRDVKLDNILLDGQKKTVKLIDFDMGVLDARPPKQPSRPDEVSIVGTKDYMAPECFKGQHSQASDLWSLGIILFIFLDGHFPFNFGSLKSMGREAHSIVKQGVRISPFLKAKHPIAVDLLEKLLAVDPKARMQTAKNALRHPWFTGTVPPPITDRTERTYRCVTRSNSDGSDRQMYKANQTTTKGKDYYYTPHNTSKEGRRSSTPFYCTEQPQPTVANSTNKKKAIHDDGPATNRHYRSPWMALFETPIKQTQQTTISPFSRLPGFMKASSPLDVLTSSFTPRHFPDDANKTAMWKDDAKIDAKLDGKLDAKLDGNKGRYFVPVQTTWQRV